MRRLRHMYRLECCYQLLVTLASLFWVGGFLLPTRIRHHEVKNNFNAICREHRPVSSWDYSTCIRAFKKIEAEDGEVATYPNPAISQPETNSLTSATAKSIIRVKKRRRSWNEYYPRLKEFYLNHGHSIVTEEDDADLFKFVTSLRINYRGQIHKNKEKSSGSSKKQRLSEEKMKNLQEIDFIWYLPQKKKTWKEYFPRLQKFHRKHGHCNVTAEDDKELNQYVTSLRINYSPYSATDQPSKTVSNSKRRLPDDKLRKLKDLNFWDMDAPPKARRMSWKGYFPRLKAFYEENGHSDVTADDDEDLYKYITSLRNNYRHQYIGNSSKENKALKWLPDEKFQALQDLNFSWFYDSRTSRAANHRRRKFQRRRVTRLWAEYYPKLQAFCETHGHCNVSSEEDNDLFLWIKSLRKRRKFLSEEKLRALQLLGLSLENQRERIKTEMISRLHLHQERYGCLSVSKSEDGDLSRWTDKFVRQNGYEKLWELLGFPSQDRKWRNGYWDEMYHKLATYHSKTGNLHVDMDFDHELEYFYRDQRREYQRSRMGFSSSLTKDRIDSLERIGFGPTRRKDHKTKWNEMVEELKSYREKYGHLEIPQQFEENPELGRWVMNQRTFYRMNQDGIYTALTEDRIEQLEQLGFIWNIKEKQWWEMFRRLEEYQKLHGHFFIEASDFENDDLRQWLNDQRYFRRSDTLKHRLNPDRIEAFEALSGFRWTGRKSEIPTKDDWSQLLNAIRDRGVAAKPKKHWFEDVNPFEQEVKTFYSEEEINALWNEEDDDDNY